MTPEEPLGRENVSPGDGLTRFLLAERDARGRLVRLDAVLNQILAAHGDPLPVQRGLAEALVLTALLGSLLKDETGQVTLQVQTTGQAQTTGGAITLLVCDWQAGALRGYVQCDAAAVVGLEDRPPLARLFGCGQLAITFDQPATKERYQGIVPLEGESLAEAVTAYFDRSEQIPTLLRVVTEYQGEAGWRAAGFLLQQLPTRPEGEGHDDIADGNIGDGADDAGASSESYTSPIRDWDHLEILSQTLTSAELLDPALSVETLLWRLYNAEGRVRVEAEEAITRGCRCDADRIRTVIGRFPQEEREAMANAEGQIVVDCAFCARAFSFDPAGLVSST